MPSQLQERLIDVNLWPRDIDPDELRGLMQRCAPAAVNWLSSRSDVRHLATVLDTFYMPLALTIGSWKQNQKSPLLVGISGAQGSGKSTLVQLLALILEKGFDLRVATLSIDDLYLPRNDRQELARTVHPLLATRGVPGTHDVRLGIDILQNLRRLGEGQSIRLPRFDKANDDRLPSTEWSQVQGPVDLILFEGWCLGARPQPEYALKIGVNDLEECEDAHYAWRSHVNRHLASDYAELFSMLDRLVFLQAPSWESVFIWRSRQEQQLAASTPDPQGSRIMDTSQLRRFVQNYERITRLMLATMPGFADLNVELGVEHEILKVTLNTKG